MLNLPQGYEKMDQNTKNQFLVIAITEQLDKNALDTSSLRNLVNTLLEQVKTQGTAFVRNSEALLKLDARLKVFETPLVAVSPVILPMNKSWLAKLLNK